MLSVSLFYKESFVGRYFFANNKFGFVKYDGIIFSSCGRLYVGFPFPIMFSKFGARGQTVNNLCIICCRSIPELQEELNGTNYSELFPIHTTVTHYPNFRPELYREVYQYA